LPLRIHCGRRARQEELFGLERSTVVLHKPASTPISELGLTPTEARLLTPAAAKLTKGDLIAMLQGHHTGNTIALNYQDLRSIHEVFARKSSLPFFPNVPCCCCSCPCCCCCAVAEVKPVV
jgi:hypothetical protein